MDKRITATRSLPDAIIIMSRDVVVVMVLINGFSRRFKSRPAVGCSMLHAVQPRTLHIFVPFFLKNIHFLTTVIHRSEYLIYKQWMVTINFFWVPKSVINRLE